MGNAEDYLRVATNVMILTKFAMRKLVLSLARFSMQQFEKVGEDFISWLIGFDFTRIIVGSRICKNFYS